MMTTKGRMTMLRGSRRVVGCVLAAVVALGGVASQVLAHEGHEHKAMGTVAAIHDERIEIETTREGKTVAFLLSAETKYKAGQAEAKRADVKPGGRVVVVYYEKDGHKHAKELLLPARGESHEGHEH